LVRRLAEDQRLAADRAAQRGEQPGGDEGHADIIAS
jgi:hypothetical protein